MMNGNYLWICGLWWSGVSGAGWGRKKCSVCRNFAGCGRIGWDLEEFFGLGVRWIVVYGLRHFKPSRCHGGKIGPGTARLVHGAGRWVGFGVSRKERVWLVIVG